MNTYDINLDGIGQEMALAYRASRKRWLRARAQFRSNALRHRLARWIGQRYGGLPKVYPTWDHFV